MFDSTMSVRTNVRELNVNRRGPRRETEYSARGGRMIARTKSSYCRGTMLYVNGTSGASFCGAIPSFWLDMAEPIAWQLATINGLLRNENLKPTGRERYGPII